MTAEEFLEQKDPLGVGLYKHQQIDLLCEYAKLKCEELLKIVAEKAKTEEKYFPGELGGSHKRVGKVDKDSILNAVNLEEFIK